MVGGRAAAASPALLLLASVAVADATVLGLAAFVAVFADNLLTGAITIVVASRSRWGAGALVAALGISAVALLRSASAMCIPISILPSGYEGPAAAAVVILPKAIIIVRGGVVVLALALVMCWAAA